MVGIKHIGVIIVHIADSKEEFLFLVLYERSHELGVVELACEAVENLAFAIGDIFLQVEGDGLCGAEIFHGVGDVDAHLFAKAEEMVDGCAGRKDNCGEVGDGNLGLTKFLGRQAFNFDERAELNLHTVFFGDFVIG